jgi:hypothetical protein
MTGCACALVTVLLLNGEARAFGRCRSCCAATYNGSNVNYSSGGYAPGYGGYAPGYGGYSSGYGYYPGYGGYAPGYGGYSPGNGYYPGYGGYVPPTVAMARATVTTLVA